MLHKNNSETWSIVITTMETPHDTRLRRPPRSYGHSFGTEQSTLWLRPLCLPRRKTRSLFWNPFFTSTSLMGPKTTVRSPPYIPPLMGRRELPDKFSYMKMYQVFLKTTAMSATKSRSGVKIKLYVSWRNLLKRDRCQCIHNLNQPHH